MEQFLSTNEQNTTIVDAYEMIEGIRNLYKLDRRYYNFQVIYNHSCRMAEKIGSSVSMPRIIAARQQHRSNMSSDSPLDYDKKNVAIRFSTTSPLT